MKQEQRKMRGAVVRVLVGAGMLLGAMAAQAAEFSVGRVDVELAGEGWKEISLPDRSQAYGGEKEGALSIQGKLYLRESTGREGQTLVLVSANSGGMGGGSAGYMTYSPVCHSDEQTYREGNEGFGQRFAQCLMVLPRYSSESVFKALAPELLLLRASGDLSHQPGVYTVWSRHAISTGSFVDVMVFVSAPINADSAAVTDTLPKGVPPAHVVWGRQLKDAVKSSVYSLSGRLVVPPIRFEPPPSGAAGG